MNNTCGECGASPNPDTGPLTAEIARLHNELLRLVAVEQAARKVWNLMTDALNCRYDGRTIPALYAGRMIPVGENEVRRWRDMLSRALETQ